MYKRILLNITIHLRIRFGGVLLQIEEKERDQHGFETT